MVDSGGWLDGQCGVGVLADGVVISQMHLDLMKMAGVGGSLMGVG